MEIIAMNTMSLSLILFSSAVVLMAVMLLVKKYSSEGREEKKLPPGSMGWPVIGETIEFLFGKPEKFVLERMRKYSPDIFKTRILGENTAVICGPHGHKFLFSNEQKYFTAFRPHSMQRIFRSYKVEPGPVKQQGRDEEAKVLRSPGFLKAEALVGYLGRMDQTTQEQMRDHWEGQSEVKAYPLAKTLTLTLACRFFLGIDQPERIARLVGCFDEVAVGMHSLVVDFPGMAFRRATKAADAIRKELRAVIAEKRSGGKMGQDILSHMVVATDASGRHMAEAEIADKIMGLLTAGYSTVATAMALFVKCVGERPDVYERVAAEQREVAADMKSGEALRWEDVNRMKYSWNAVNEVMRLFPPLQGTFREALEEFTYAGYTVPKGWKVYWTVSSTNMDAHYFPDPTNFDPTRYEDAGSFPPFTFVPFGGGPRMCPGKEYARLAILTFVHNLVMRFKWELLCPHEKVVGDMMPAPNKGLPIRLIPR